MTPKLNEICFRTGKMEHSDTVSKPIGKRQRLDFFLPSHGVVIELDSYFHDNTEQQARDRRKDKLVKEAGWKMVRMGNRRSTRGNSKSPTSTVEL